MKARLNPRMSLPWTTLIAEAMILAASCQVEIQTSCEGLRLIREVRARLSQSRLLLAPSTLRTRVWLMNPSNILTVEAFNTMPEETK
jgi:hypothetical protein